MADPAQGAEHAAAAAHFLGLDASGWVSVSITIFFLLLVWKKVPALITGALDARIAKVKGELEQAAKLRRDAEMIKIEMEGKLADSQRQAQAIIAAAEAEAARMTSDAQARLEAMIARRTQMAEDKIAAAERTAEAQVLAQAGNDAVSAAKAIIADRLDASTSNTLVDKALKDLEQRIN